MLQSRGFHKFASIDEQLDRNRSLLWAKSKDYLVDVKIAGAAQSNREEISPLTKVTY
jgi:hypothetical protein